MTNLSVYLYFRNNVRQRMKVSLIVVGFVVVSLVVIVTIIVVELMKK